MPEESLKTAIIAHGRTVDPLKTLRSLITALLIVGSTYVRYVANAEPYRSMQSEPQGISNLGGEFDRSPAE